MNKYLDAVADNQEGYKEGPNPFENIRIYIFCFHGWDLSWKDFNFMSHSSSRRGGCLDILLNSWGSFVFRHGHVKCDLLSLPVLALMNQQSSPAVTNKHLLLPQYKGRCISPLNLEIVEECFSPVWLLVSTKAWQELPGWVWVIRIRSVESIFSIS